MNNLACRIFKEQIDLLLSLPDQDEAKTVLYQAVVSSYKQTGNQFNNQSDNQNENQFDSAYISVSDSVSLSVLSKNILSLLSKNIQWKEFSNNYGGRRENAGRKPQNNQIENQIESQNDNQSDNTKNIENQSSILSFGLETKPDKKEIYKERFENFWIEYPRQRRGNKEKAYRAYCRVIKDGRATPEKLLEAAKDYAVSDEVKRGYAKGCEAWLNDDRFNIEYKKQEQEWMI